MGSNLMLYASILNPCTQRSPGVLLEVQSKPALSVSSVEESGKKLPYELDVFSLGSHKMKGTEYMKCTL